MASAASVFAAASYPKLPPDHLVFGTTRKMKELREKLGRLAVTAMPVLIRGESGTGKEIIAQLIHYRSTRNAGPLVKVTCSAIAGTPLEGELFAYEKAATAGALGTKPQIVQQAACGTLFLDEIGDLSKGLQAKVLQLLQDRQFDPLGGLAGDQIDARIVCATNRNLEGEIRSGGFRADLFYRINVASIDLPPLRERKADIQALVEYFLDRYRKQFNSVVPPISPATMQSFEELSWPGNIRELENLIRRYVILGCEDPMCERSTNSVAPVGQSDSSQLSLKKVTKQALWELEREIILQVLEKHRWNRKQTARALNISYSALLYKLKQAGVAARMPDKGRLQ